jgi:hypothetical protein
MQTMLAQQGNPELRAYFIWAPFIHGDSVEAARSATERYLAPNSVYFWLPTVKIAQDLSIVLRLGAGRIAWDVFLLYKRGTIWETTIPEPAYWQQQLEILQGDPFNTMVLEAKIQQALRQP